MGLEAVSLPPTFVSREEHASLTSQTPASFGDIPPVLRFNDQVEITLSPPSGSGSGSSVNIEGRIQGQLWVTEAYVAFSLTSTGADK
jgi:nucleotide-sensitive chloride channel 1A